MISYLKFILILLISTTFGLVKSQDLKWFKTFSDETNNPLGIYLKTRTDTSGNMIIGGDDVWQGAYLHKLDTAGNVLWSKTLNTVTDLTDIAVDNQNNIIITGVYIGHLPLSDDFTLTDGSLYPNYYGEVFIVKYAPDGELKWAISSKKPKDVSASFHPLSFFIDTDAFGNIYTNGVFYDGAVFDNHALVTSLPEFPIPYIIKISPEGRVLFAKSHSTKGIPDALFCSKDYVYQFYNNDQKMYMFKFNFCGEVVKRKTFSFYDMYLERKTFDGFYFMAAIEPAPCFNAQTGPTYCTHTFAKYDFENDTVISLLKVSGVDYNITNITPDHNGNIYFCGNQYEPEDPDLLTFNSLIVPRKCSFILKYNADDSKFEWIKTYSVARFGFASMSILDKRNLFIVGSFGYGGTIPFNGSTFDIPYSGRTYIIGKHHLSDSLKLDSYKLPYWSYSNNCSVNVSNQPLHSDNLNLNPNPCTSYVEVKGNDIQNIEVYDLLGHKTKITGEIRQGSYILDTSQMIDGIYILYIKTGNETFARKVFKITH